jgi:hypothetical protein
MKLTWLYLALCFVGGHCDSSTTKKPTMMEQTLTMQNEDASLTAHFLPESDTAMQIRYRVENKTPQSLYLFNKLYQGFERDVLLTNKQFVYVFLDDKQALICKAIAPVPPGMSVAAKVFPCVTKIPPHGAYEESFTVGLPLSFQTPYQQAVGRSKRVITKPLFFGLGYFVGTRFTEAQERQVNTSDGPSILFDVFTYDNQKWLNVGPLAKPVMVFETR